MPKIPSQSSIPESIKPWPLPKHWAWVRIDSVGLVQLGKQLTRERRPGDRLVPYLRAANITMEGLDLSDLQEMAMSPMEVERYALAKGDVVLTEASGSAAHVGKSAVWRGEVDLCAIQNHVIRFRPHAVLSEYAQIVFRAFLVMGHFAKVARGVGIQNLGAARFAELLFPLAPMATQKGIIDEVNARLRGLSDARASLESALRGLKEKTDTLLEMAATGQIGGQTRTNLKGVERPADELPLLGEGAVPTEALPVPKHWRVVRVEQAGQVQLGRQRTPEHERGEHMMPYLRVANVFEDRIDTSDVLTMNFSPQEQKVFRLTSGDILLNEGQSPELVGRPALYRGEPRAVCFQNTLVRFRAGPDVEPRFALIVFRHYFRSGRFTRIARGSTNIAHLGAKRFGELPFPVPPRDEQRQIADALEQSLAEDEQQRKTVEASLNRLSPAEEELLRAALTGELLADKMSGESATELLERIGPPPGLVVEKRPATARKRTTMKSDHTRKPLVATLQAAGGRLSAEELFESAGYDRDSSEDIEQFYLLLRDELKRTIREVPGKRGEKILEAI